MKKRTVALFMAGIMLICSACTAKTAEKTEVLNQSDSAGEITEEVTIRMANYAILETGYAEFWSDVKKEFEEKNPGIKLEYVSAPCGEMVNTVINMAGGGDKVDMVFGEIDWVPTLEDTGLLIPVSDVFQEEYLNDFYPNIMEAFEIDGKAYGLPMYVSPYILYYNADLFEKAGVAEVPETYDEMLEAAEKLSQLKDANGNQVYAFGQTTASVPVSGAALNAMIFNFGGNLISKDKELDIDNKGFKDAVSMLKVLDEKVYNPQNAKLKDLRNLFALGQLAMYYDQSWGFNGVKSINPEAVDFAESANPLRGGDGQGESLLQAHCLMYADNGEQNRFACRKFTEFLITEEILGDYIQNLTPAYPAVKSMENMKLNSVLDGAAGSVTNVKAQTFVSTIAEINLELTTLAQAVTVSNKDIDEAIEDFRKAAASALEKK